MYTWLEARGSPSAPNAAPALAIRLAEKLPDADGADLAGAHQLSQSSAPLTSTSVNLVPKRLSAGGGRGKSLDGRLAVGEGDVVRDEVHAHDIGRVRRPPAGAVEQRGQQPPHPLTDRRLVPPKGSITTRSASQSRRIAPTSAASHARS